MSNANLHVVLRARVCPDPNVLSPVASDNHWAETVRATAFTDAAGKGLCGYSRRFNDWRESPPGSGLRPARMVRG